MPERGQHDHEDEPTRWPMVDNDEESPPPALQWPGRDADARAAPGRERADRTQEIALPPPLPSPPPQAGAEDTELIRLPRFEPGPARGRPAQPRQPWHPPAPPHAAPERTGPPPDERDQDERDHDDQDAVDEPVARRRRARPVLLAAGALGVVAAVAAGVVFAVPGLAGRLGLVSSEPEVVIAAPPPPVEFAPALRPPGTQAPAPAPAGVAAALAGPAGSPALGTLTGTVLDAATGEVLWSQGAQTPLVPASTGKLLTAAAALLSLNHTDQLTTKVVAGPHPGSVVIVGGGDPTLSSLKVGVESAYPGAAHLADLAAQVKASAGTVDTVLVDVERYAGDGLAPGWDNRDIAGGYIAPIVPAMLDGGRRDATKQDTPRTDNPARALAEELAARLGARVPATAKASAPPGAQVLGEVRSAPLVELVDTMLLSSDNVLAEAIAREVARVAGQEVSFAGASKATLDILQSNGFSTDDVTLVDGSGLSIQDKVPAGLLASILAVAAGADGADPRTAKLRPLLGGLPVAGGSGTLAVRYQNPGAAVGKGWVRAKTGTLSGVNSLAGVVLDADGRLLVFAMMTSGSEATTARAALDVVAATLRKCGCR